VAVVTLISVVVPIYDVEDYLDDCLRSLARQTVGDFEAIMVDDGSTDSSAAIASRYAERDPRFKLVRRVNGGLSRARNTGIDVATGRYLAFLDSDDVLPPDAYERLLGAVERTGSDFATGNVQRLEASGCTQQAGFLAAAFGRTRLRTHVRRFAPLLEDRTAWNKLWRRAFWDARGLRFPEGRLHEDIPVVLPAHFEAASVDVVGAPVYRYRVRDGSITRRRNELRALRDRLSAVEHVHGYIAGREAVRQRRRYERSVVRHDLRYHLDLLPDAEDEYRALFMEWAGAFLERAGARVCDGLPAAERVKYRLVRSGRLEELVALLELQRAGVWTARRRLGRYYGDYPVGGAQRLGRRDRELALAAHLSSVEFADGRLRLSGHAYVNALGAAAPADQRLQIAAVRRGSRRALRMRLAPARLATRPVRRRDLDPRLQWSGFAAALAPERFDDGGDAEWDLFAYVRVGGLRRRRAVFSVDDPAIVRTIDLPGRALVQATVSADGRATVRVSAQWARIELHRRLGARELELSGRACLARDSEPQLELAADDAALRFPLEVRGSTFRVSIDVAALREAAGEADWAMRIVASSGRPVLALAESLGGAAWRLGGGDMALERTSTGGGRLLDRRSVTVIEPAPFAAALPTAH
jgi:CDP-glycerol glycerophosphotransferase